MKVKKLFLLQIRHNDCCNSSLVSKQWFTVILPVNFYECKHKPSYKKFVMRFNGKCYKYFANIKKETISRWRKPVANFEICKSLYALSIIAKIERTCWIKPALLRLLRYLLDEKEYFCTNNKLKVLWIGKQIREVITEWETEKSFSFITKQRPKWREELQDYCRVLNKIISTLLKLRKQYPFNRPWTWVILLGCLT